MDINSVRVVVAEDHEGMRHVVSKLLNEHFTVVESVQDGDRLVQVALDLQPDVMSKRRILLNS
jgi:CheY-like chemotaxis protein